MSGLRTWEKLDNPLHIISLGAGRQSSAMYLMAVAGQIEPLPYCAIFSDTGNEPPWVYEQLEYLQQYQEKIPIHVVANGNIYQDSIQAVNGNSPWGEGRWVGPPVFSEGGGPIKRKCTQHYKIKPKEDKARELLKLIGRKYLVDWRGHTTNEIQRAKPDKRQYYNVRWPLLEKRMSDHDCAMWMNKNGHPEFTWSACEICPFRLRELDSAKKLSGNGKTWERILLLDSGIRNMKQFGLNKRHYFNADYLPMKHFIELECKKAPLSFFDCDGGMCGL